MKLEETEEIEQGQDILIDGETEVSESAAATFKDIQLYRSYAEQCVLQNKDFETFSEFRYPVI